MRSCPSPVVVAALVAVVALAMLSPPATGALLGHGAVTGHLQEEEGAGDPDRWADFGESHNLIEHGQIGHLHGDSAYRNVMVIVAKYDGNGMDVSDGNMEVVVKMLRGIGARNIEAAGTLPFVTASVPAERIPDISGHDLVYRVDYDGALAYPTIDKMRMTVGATAEDLRGLDGTVADGSGVTLGIVDQGVNHPLGLNDRVVGRVICDSLRCSFASADEVVGSDPENLEVSHGTLVALVAAGSGFPEHNGIAPGVEILDAGIALMFLGAEDATISTAFSWLLRNDADVANLSFGFGRCSDVSSNSTHLLIPGEAVDSGMVVVVSAGNAGTVQGLQDRVPVYQSINEWGCSHNVITVGGIDNRDQDNIRMYDDSGKGPATHRVNGTTYPILKPEIVAPAMMQIPRYTASNTTDTLYGTSFSTPAVSAVAALVLQERDMEPAAVKTSILLGADWTGPVPCTSVQYEMNNATDNCSHERQPSSLAEATGDGSLEIINNVGFGILDAAKTLDYVSAASGRHIVEDNLDSDTDIDGYAFEVVDAEEPVKIILSWTVDQFYEYYYAPRGENYFADLGFTVDCPGMDTISAQSAYQSNEFAVFVPAETGTCTVTVMGSDIDTPRRSQQDYALASTLPLYAVDIERPDPAISSGEQSPTNSHSITFTVDFGEQVDTNTFTSSDVSASSGTVSDPLPASGTDTGFVFEVSGLQVGNLTVFIPEGGVLDLAGHNNTASDPYMMEIERTRPAPVLSTAAFSPVNASSITFTVDFGEHVDTNTFTPSDVSTSSGTVSDPLPAGGTDTGFIFEVSDLAAGNLTVFIPEGGVLDLAGNNNTASNSYVVEIKRPRPLPAISAAESSPTNAHSITFTVDFGVPVNAATFTASDISASAGTVSDLLPANRIYTEFTFEVSGLQVGNLTVSIPEGGVLDPAGNGNTASDPYMMEIERTRPVPVLSTAAFSPVNASSITFTVDFGEQVDANTFTPSDVSASAGTVSDPLPASGTDTGFTFEVSDLAAGNLTVFILEGGVLDLAGNGNTASDLLTFTVTSIPAGTTPEAAFVTTWQTTGANESILIPVGEATGRYTVTWGDASIDTDVSGHLMHVYKTAGTYTVSIYGDFSQIYLPYHPENSLKLKSIEQWGDIRWESMRGAFSGASNMVYRATDAPDLSAVTDTSEMFRFASIFNGNLSNWDVSSVTDASQMFVYTNSFNGDISSWNVSAATDMYKMFKGANSFARNLGDWYVVLDDTTMSDASETLAISAQNAYLDGKNPTYMVNDANFVVVDGALAIKPGRSVLPGTYNVTVTVGGVIGDTRGTLHSRTVQVTMEGDTAPPIVLSTSYLTGNGTLTVTFSESLDRAIHYDRLHIRNAGQSSDGILLDDAQIKRSSGPTVTVVLTAQQRADFARMAITQLDVDQGAVSDVTGNKVAAAVDLPVDTIAAVAGSSAFATTWTVGAGDQITIPVGGSAATYSIGWGDGTAQTGVTGDQTHTYEAGGNYTVLISDDFERLYLNDHLAASKLASIDQWGDAQWTSMESAFAGASNMVYRAADAPDLSAVTDTSGMFRSASSFNGDISDWDTSSVTGMESMFHGATSFNGDLSDWDVSEVTDMGDMFFRATSFNGDLSDWDVSEVTDMGDMFFRATSFNGDLSDWDVSEVTDMGDMFFMFFRAMGSMFFNGDLSDWDVSEVTDMGSMFFKVHSFNGDLSDWDVSSVTDMNGMFADASYFDGNLSSWDVSSAIDMSEMFYNAQVFNQSLDSWNVSSVTDMNGMFADASYFDGNLSAWDVSSVTDMNSMFYGALYFNSDLSAWDVSSVTDMTDMFYDTSYFDSDLSSWDVSSVTDMSSMFAATSSFDGNLSSWNVSSVIDMSEMFYNAKVFNQPLDSWNVSSVTDMTAMFHDAISFNQNLGAWYVVLDGDTLSDSADSIGIAAQNQVLDGQDLAYTIDGTAPNGDKFRIVNGSHLVIKTDQTVAQGQYNVTIKSTGSFGVGNSRMAEITVSYGAVLQINNSPSVKAGYGQTVREGATVTLAGNATDPDGDPMTYLWTHNSTVPGITLVNATSASATFVAPQVDSDTGIVFTLTVDDGTVTSSDSVSVTITHNSPPSVEAGPDMSVVEGATVTLAGNATDGDGDSLTYSWRHTSGMPAVDLLGADTPSPTFTAPDVSSDTGLVFEMIVYDGSENSTDTVKITIRDTPDRSHFVTTWQTDAAGESITIPVGPATGTYTVNWGDGNASVNVTGDQTHVYDNAGTYTVAISGDFTRMHLNDRQPNADRLQSIDQWGDTKWKSMNSAFQGASNAVYRATDTPDLSAVTDTSGMFRSASSFNGNISDWDTSSVTGMESMFRGATFFNGNLSAWDVSKVTDMGAMFFKAHSFNGDLSVWDVSEVTDMGAMFHEAHSFNGNLSAWDVSEVTDMLGMFYGATSFNGNLSAWDVSEVTGMGDMFYGATSFNGDLSAWDVSEVTGMGGMFHGATSFNGNLSDWDVSEVTNMGAMFFEAHSFNGNLSAWDVSEVTDMLGMFHDVISFNGNLSAWDVSKVTDMGGMFHGATSFNGDLSDWDVSEVTDMGAMFHEAHSFNGDLSAWDVSEVTDMGAMFHEAHSFNGDLSAWDVSEVTNMSAMFHDAISFNQNLGAWYVVLDGDTLSDSADSIGIAAQNQVLDGQDLAYTIDGTAPNGDKFRIVNGSHLVIKTDQTVAQGQYNVTIKSTGSFGVGNSRMAEITVSYGAVLQINNSPSVKAGYGQTVREGATVTLAGNATDPDGDPMTYLWTHNSTVPGITLVNATSASATFVAPQVDSDTDIVFTLTVDDGTVASSDSVSVTITHNSPPSVEAGSAQTVQEGTGVSLNGSATDPDEDVMTYLWTHNSTSSDIALANSTSPSTTFTAPYVSSNTTLTLTLTADDGTAEVSDSVDILIMPTQNVHPVLDVILEQAVDEMSTLIFVARATDEDLPSDTLTYGLEDPPAGASMNSATGAFTWTPTEYQNGIHTLTVTVSDGRGGTDSQDVKVTVNEVNMPPTLDVILAQTIDELAMLTFTVNASDDDLHPGVGIEVVAGKLKIPWSIDWTPDRTALFTERGGDLRVIRDGILLPDPIFSVDVNDDEEGGLLGIAVDPEFEENQYIYMYQTYKTDGTTLNKVVRYTLANVTVSEDLVLVDGIPGASYHDGGRIQFGPDGNLYITTGDAGNPSLAQDLDSLAGKILRITREGAIPQDNPFSNSTVWSWGHRNPQGMDWDGSGNLIATEHGPSGERGEAHDEINLILPGANYGWPETVGDESMAGMQDPLLHTGSETWAPSGSEFYDGDMIPGWTGKYFVANLRGEHLRMIDLDLSNNGTHSHEGLFEGQFGRLRDVQTGPDGFLYLLTSNRDGRGLPVSNDDRILKIVPVFDSALSRPANVLTYGLEASPAGASMDPATGTFTWRPAEDQNGIHTITVTVSDGNGGTNSQEVQVTVNVVNVAPIVGAGSDQTALEGQTVMLNGTATDADGDSLTYLWSHNSSLAIQLANSTSPSTTFAAPAVDADTAVTFTLTVDDGTTTATDSFEVTVTDIQILNSPPSVEAGPAQTVQEGAGVSLNGSATDPDGDPMTYLWTHNSVAPGITLVNATSASTTFVAPQVDSDTGIVFTLTVDDGTVASSDSVSVTITHNSPPSVEAGPDMSVWEGATVTLAGNATDGDGDSLTYSWRHTSGLPAVDLLGADTPSPTFTAPDVSSDTGLVFEMIVYDGSENSTDTVKITIRDTPDRSHFVTTWQTDAAGESITIPVGPATGTYTVNWGDGNTSVNVTGDQTHVYDNAGIYTVAISGDFTRMHLNDRQPNADRLQSIDQWGDTKWKSMNSAFQGASNVVYRATDVPDLSRATSMRSMFYDATSLDMDLSGWDVSSITDISSMFYGASSFDGDISGWDISSVTHMNRMFYGASSFDGDISGWDVSSVTDMNMMFYGASSFDGDISGWDVSSVTDMSWLFYDASSFDGDISGWDVSSVTDMDRMFSGASSFDGDISGWDVSSVTDMNDMFSYATDFAQNLGKWYIVLDDTAISDAGEALAISAQNAYLDVQGPTYAVDDDATGNGVLFEVTGGALAIKSGQNPTPGSYNITITSTGIFGTDNSRTVEITVDAAQANTPPTVKVGLDQTVEAGSAVILAGNATDADDDPLAYLWSHDSVLDIVLANLTAPSTGFTAPQVNITTTVTFTLTVDDGAAASSDSASVTITAGANNTNIVNIPETPLASRDIGLLTLSSTIPGTVQISWDTPGETPVDYRVSWAKVNESFLTWTDLSGNAFPTDTSHTVTSLEEGEQYKVIVRARYSDSSGDWSYEAIIITARAVATAKITPDNSTSPGAPHGLAVSRGGGSGTLVVSWQAPFSDGGSALTGYVVQWKETGGSWDVLEDVSENTTTATTHTVTGLTNGVSYAVRVLATNQAGSGSPSAEETGTPLTIREIAGLTLNSTIPGTVQASWDVPNDVPVDYRISWAKVNEPFLTWTDLSGNAFPTDASYTITDLEEDETYKVVVRARYSGASGDWSDETIVTVAGT